MSGPLTEAARSRLRWIRQRPDLPGWWTMLQIALGVAFFFYVAYQMMTGGHHDTATAGAQKRDLGHGIVVTGPGAPVAPAAPTGSGPLSSDNVGEQEVVSPSDETASPGSGGAVTLLDQSGAPVSVPGEASDVAIRALRAAFDPSLFSGLPVAAGEKLNTSGTKYPNANVGPLQVISSSDTSITFAATGDPDGTGRTLRPMRATVVSQNGHWFYTTKS